LGGTKKILILGLGNEVLGDESLGLIMVNDLAQKGYFPETDYAFSYTGGLNILDQIEGYDSLLIIDTTCGNDCEVGTIHHYGLDNFRETLHLSSEHDASFITTLDTGKRLGLKIPGQIHIIAIEIYRDLYLAEKLSDNISGQYDKIRSEIINFIKKINNF
jgi:hydrogenase maturation protease